MAKKSNKVISYLLVIAMVVSMCFGYTTTAYAGDQLDPYDVTLNVNGTDNYTVKGFNASYKFNTYVSLRDVANALNGTEKQFNYTYNETDGIVMLELGEAYVPIGNENKPGAGTTENVSCRSNKLQVNGKTVKYYTYQLADNNDTYMKLIDISMILDTNIDYTDETTIAINTEKDFYVDIEQLDKDGYFNTLHGVYLANAETGEVIFSSKEDNIAAIASTTKLMTYLLVMEAIDDGKISMDDEIVLSKAVETESHSEDAVIPMKEGQKTNIPDLLKAMLLPSSNEAALALAEHVAGSEKAFVKMMNERAAELGLSTAEFYNPHGLPNFTQSGTTSKRQNKMCAKDLFTLAQYIINNYPQITEITSLTEARLESLDYDATNSNPLLYNMEGIIGLKTGTTNRAGCCLVAALPIQVNGEFQTVISVEMGAESSAERGEKSAVLLKYAQQYYAEKEQNLPPEVDNDNNENNNNNDSDNGDVNKPETDGNITNPDTDNEVVNPDTQDMDNTDEIVDTDNEADNEKAPAENVENADNADNPQTGDSSNLMLYVAIMMAVLVSVYGVYKVNYRRNHK